MFTKENISRQEQKVRVTAGAFLIALGAAGYSGLIPVANMIPQATTSVILVVIGLILIATGYFRRCLVYRLLEKDTSRE